MRHFSKLEVNTNKQTGLSLIDAVAIAKNETLMLNSLCCFSKAPMPKFPDQFDTV